MRTIWKFPIDIANTQTVMMPKGTDILTVQMHNEKPAIWAIVETDAPMEPRTIVTYGTGHLMPGKTEMPNKYLGTIQAYSGMLVLHLFETIS